MTARLLNVPLTPDRLQEALRQSVLADAHYEADPQAAERAFEAMELAVGIWMADQRVPADRLSDMASVALCAAAIATRLTHEARGEGL